jgi:hypothetical protein
VPILAEVGESSNTVMAMATARSYKATDNRVPGLNIGDTLSNFFYITRHFVTGQSRQSASSMLPLDGVDITVADGCGRDAYFHFTFLQPIHFHIFYYQGFTKFITDGSFQFSLLIFGLSKFLRILQI